MFLNFLKHIFLKTFNEPIINLILCNVSIIKIEMKINIYPLNNIKLAYKFIKQFLFKLPATFN